MERDINDINDINDKIDGIIKRLDKLEKKKIEDEVTDNILFYTNIMISAFIGFIIFIF
jgi:hypothetical protein